MTIAPGMIVSANSVRYSPGWKYKKRRREERAGDGPGVIHRAMEPEHPAARMHRGEIGEHRVARRSLIPLPSRSATRIASTCGHVVATPISGRIADARP